MFNKYNQIVQSLNMRYTSLKYAICAMFLKISISLLLNFQKIVKEISWVPLECKVLIAQHESSKNCSNADMQRT